MKLHKNLIVTIFLLAVMALSGCVPVEAPAYPSGPLTLYVPFRAGGGTDTQARVLAVEMEKTLGQTVNVVNNPGAGGTVGMQELLASGTDGMSMAYTVSVAVTANPLLQELDYGISDFKVVGISSTFQTAMVTSGDAPFATWDEFIAYAKENPGLKHMFLGQQDRIAMEAIAAAEGIELEYVPGQGGADVAPALISGDVDTGFSGGIHVRFLETGEMIPLLNLNSTGPLVATPDLPMGDELYGVANDIQGALIVPGGVSDDIVNTLADAFQKAVESDAYAEVMANLAFPVTYSAYPEAQEIWQAQYDSFAAALE